MTPSPKAASEYQEIQEQEIMVLKSIYMEDYEHVERAGAWNVSLDSDPLSLELKVFGVWQINRPG